eukprot:TRINITY_DN68424_c0_g1_i1.p1 TRINITY_DN68424_c0_g1~~TRINITY_DN68424_c0_g1_i1.p1  ORF type:complete len:133 (-),score=34.50 TRINITY_DN68424_c0_g1_i1:404-802(-)
MSAITSGSDEARLPRMLESEAAFAVMRPHSAWRPQPPPNVNKFFSMKPMQYGLLPQPTDHAVPMYCYATRRWTRVAIRRVMMTPHGTVRGLAILAVNPSTAVAWDRMLIDRHHAEEEEQQDISPSGTGDAAD